MKFQLPGNGAIRSKMAGKCVSKQKKKKGKTKILLYALSNRENCLNFFRKLSSILFRNKTFNRILIIRAYSSFENIVKRNKIITHPPTYISFIVISIFIPKYNLKFDPASRNIHHRLSNEASGKIRPSLDDRCNSFPSSFLSRARGETELRSVEKSRGFSVFATDLRRAWARNINGGKSRRFP